MKFPFTYHSKKNDRLVSLNIDDHDQIFDIEVWDELNNRWLQIPEDTTYYNDYLIDLQNTFTSNLS